MDGNFILEAEKIDLETDEYFKYSIILCSVLKSHKM
jgi:hypothetical protein